MKIKIVFLAIGLLLAGSINAQSIDNLTSTKSRGGDDPNITVGEVLNPVNGFTDLVQPEAKGGERTRGAYCKVVFDNWTNLYLKCYVDGTYRGYIAPWGDGAVTVGSGSTSAYVVAEFDDGSRLTWGPIRHDCYGDWTLKIEE